MPARDEEETLGACLDSILAQEYRNLQVIVVDGASTDATREVVLAYAEDDPRVELVLNDRANIPASLNLGLDAAKGSWLVRVDAHSVIPSGYVQRAVMRLREGEWGGVGGRKSGRGETLQGRAIAVALGSRFGVGNSLYHYGTKEQETDHVPFGSYPVDVLRGLGGWNETLLANEDYEFDLRLREAGYRLLFDPELSIDWKSRQTLSALFSQYHRYGRSKFRWPACTQDHSAPVTWCPRLSSSTWLLLVWSRYAIPRGVRPWWLLTPGPDRRLGRCRPTPTTRRTGSTAVGVRVHAHRLGSWLLARYC